MTTTAKKKRNIKPLTDAERLDYNNDLDDIEECKEAGLSLGRALLDVRKRKLYREEYDTWEQFVEGHPRVGICRSRSYQLMDFAKAVMEMSTTVDTAGLNERESRNLEAIPCIPDRAEVLKRIRAANLPLNEKNVECFYHELANEKKAKAKERRDLSVFEPDEDEEGAEQGPEAPKDVSQEDRLKERGAKGEFDKERRYAVRLCDHYRLGNKDVNKSKKEDFRPTNIRQKAREILASARRALDKLDKWIAELDAEDRKAGTA